MVMKWIALAALAVMTSRATAQQTAPVTTPPPAPAAGDPGPWRQQALLGRGRWDADWTCNGFALVT
jgi:hypothetical protein